MATSAVTWRVGVALLKKSRTLARCLMTPMWRRTGLLSALLYAMATERIFVVDLKHPTFTSLFQSLPIPVSVVLFCVVITLFSMC